MSGLNLPDHNKWDIWQAQRRHIKRLQGEEPDQPEPPTVTEQLIKKFNEEEHGN